jgi:hypothetical protein
MGIIKTIEIRHFRSIHNGTIREIGDFNVFAGSNDSGKSNILRALNLFFNGQTSFLETFKFKEDYSKLALLEAREKKKGRQFISIRLNLDEGAFRGKDELKRLAKLNGGLWIAREWWPFLDTYREKQPDFIENAGPGIKRSFGNLISSLKFIYIPAFKNNEVFSHVLSLVANEEGIFIDQQAKDELNIQIASAATDLAEDFSELTTINTRVSLPITLDSFWSSLQVATDFEKSKEKEITRGSEDDYLISLIARGEGIKSIFTPIILGWLARNNSKRYWIWGIDEPENSLESSRTIALFKKFCEYSKYAQIFASSHSPVFMFPSTENLTDTPSTFITTQDIEGDSRFRKIDVNDSILKSKLIKEFGLDYGTFLGMQEDYAKKLQESQSELENIKAKIRQIVRPVIFVEGDIDELYLKKAIEIFREDEYIADIRWIGMLDQNGQARFTGKDSLNRFEAFALANTDFITSKVILLYDVDTGKQRAEIGNLLVLSPNKIPGNYYHTGIEHLIVFPADFDHKAFTRTETKRTGDKSSVVSEPKKRELCNYICNELCTDEQRIYLSNLNTLLSSLEPFIQAN